MSALSPFRPFYIVGPTGSGKSDFAIALARVTGGAIVNADAFQLYRGLPVVTACPDSALWPDVPHHLYEVLSPDQTCDAGRYLSLAIPVLRELASRNRLPIVVGGSGLYVKALTHGLSDAPASHPGLRASLDHLTRGELIRLLAKLDPLSAASIEPGNRRYLQRAVEITLLARKPASELREAWTEDPPGLRGVILNRPREELHDRIHRRALAMLRGGAIEEVRSIASWSSTASKAIGVREIQSLLRGEIDEARCLSAIEISTRRYAKRQASWFRRESWLTSVNVSANGGTEAQAIEIARSAGLL